MSLRRAVVVDRDPAVLARLEVELGRLGYAVETVDSVVGLTPDLVALSQPNVLVLDAGMPGLDAAGLFVLVRSLKARLQLKVAVSTEEDARALKEKLGADHCVSRVELVASGVQAFGVKAQAEKSIDVRALIDEVLGKRAPSEQTAFEVKLDLFSESRLCVGRDGGAPGVFVATTDLPAVGQRVELKLNLFGKRKLHLRGEVAWHRAPSGYGGAKSSGFGAKLLDLSEEENRALMQLLEIREPLTWIG